MGELISKKEIIRCIQQLNKHYKKSVKFKTGYPIDGRNTPCADRRTHILIFPPVEGFYDKHIVAHEYAHILHAEGIEFMSRIQVHGKRWEAWYIEVCLVLGIFAIPPMGLVKIVRIRLNLS